MENKIYKICEDVLTITDDEIKELREIAEGQKRYNNPLRMATSGWQQELGEHNDKVLDAIIALKKELEAWLTVIVLKCRAVGYFVRLMEPQ